MANKRRRDDNTVANDEHDSDSAVVEISAPRQRSKSRRWISTEMGHSSPRGSISPPPARNTSRPCGNFLGKEKGKGMSLPSSALGALSSAEHDLISSRRLTSSPIQLSTVNGLAASSNVDTVSLKDILGDPLIRECWLFNYLIDVDFIMYAQLLCLRQCADNLRSGPSWMKTLRILCG